MKTSFITFVALLLSITTYSQASRAAFEVDMLGRNGIIKSLNNIDGNLSYDDISGSPYLNKNFAEGSIIMNDSTSYVHVPLRYNMYTDKIEFEGKNDIVLEIASPQLYDSFTFSNQTFTYESYLDESNLKNGYFEVLADGNIRLLKQYVLKFKPAVPAKAYQDAVPPTFDQLDSKYYIQKGNETALELRSKTKSAELLSTYCPEIEGWIKKKKLKINKEEDLVQIIEHCNSVQ